MALTDNIIAYYKLDGNANDSVGSRNGSSASVTYSSGNGKINSGGGFNGTNSNIELPSNTYISTTNFTVSAWFKTTSHSSSVGEIVSSDNSSNVRLFQLAVASSKVRLVRFDSSDSVITNISSSSNYNDGNWHFAVVTFDSSVGSKIYVDGTQVASDTVLTQNNNESSIWSIGSNTNPTKIEFFNGAIDEVGIWDRTLSGSEVSSLYKSGLGNQYPFQQDIIMSGGTGDFDLTGYDASIFKDSVQTIMTADPVAFTFTGYDAEFKQDLKLTIDTIEFDLTGNNVSIVAPTSMKADTVNFTLTGNDAVLEYRIRNYLMRAETVEFNLTGYTAIFTGQKWQNNGKSPISVMVNKTKNTVQFENQTKNTETFINIDKS